MKASNHGDVCHFVFAPQLPSVRWDWFWELWLCFSALLSHKEYVLFSRQIFFSHKCPLTLLPANRAKSPPKRGLGAFRVILFVLCVCLLPYREHWIWSYDCRAGVADRHIAGHCQLSNHPSLCSLAMDYPNCSWCQQWASCSEKYAR